MTHLGRSAALDTGNVSGCAVEQLRQSGHLQWEKESLGALVSSVLKVRSTGSCLLSSFLKSPHTSQQKDTATALTETLAPSWGAASRVTLQVFSALTALPRNRNSTAGDLLVLLSNANFSRKVIR